MAQSLITLMHSMRVGPSTGLEVAVDRYMVDRKQILRLKGMSQMLCVSCKVNVLVLFARWSKYCRITEEKFIVLPHLTLYIMQNINVNYNEKLIMEFECIYRFFLLEYHPFVDFPCKVSFG